MDPWDGVCADAVDGVDHGGLGLTGILTPHLAHTDPHHQLHHRSRDTPPDFLIPITAMAAVQSVPV